MTAVYGQPLLAPASNPAIQFGTVLAAAPGPYGVVAYGTRWNGNTGIGNSFDLNNDWITQ